MTRTVFRNAFLLGVLVLVLCGLLFYGVQYRQTEDEAFTALQQEAVYAERGLALSGIEYLEGLDDVNRITWIGADGTVLFDNGSPQADVNQLRLPEVAQALQKGVGQAVRRSESNGVTTMYYALRRDDGTVLRLGRPLSVVLYALATVSPVLWILVFVLLISAGLAFRVAKQIVRPINDMDLDDPDSVAYPELAPLVEKIKEQRQTIERETDDRERLRREFTANVSHELKTPLTSISGFAELMSQGVVSNQEMQGFSSDIYRESQRLIALVDDIMKVSQLDEDAVGPAHEDVDLYELASDVLDSLGPVAERQGVSLALTGGPGVVKGSYQLLDEMVYNLCDNAIKYNKKGGSVTVDVADEAGQVRLSVSDTGIGIPADHQARVFERFYRVDKSHSKEIGGTGLGLSIVKHGAQFHGADVDLQSEEGKGTIVTLTFQDSQE